MAVIDFYSLPKPFVFGNNASVFGKLLIEFNSQWQGILGQFSKKATTTKETKKICGFSFFLFHGLSVTQKTTAQPLPSLSGWILACGGMKSLRILQTRFCVCVQMQSLETFTTTSLTSATDILLNLIGFQKPRQGKRRKKSIARLPQWKLMGTPLMWGSKVLHASLKRNSEQK